EHDLSVLGGSGRRDGVRGAAVYLDAGFDAVRAAARNVDRHLATEARLDRGARGHGAGERTSRLHELRWAPGRARVRRAAVRRLPRLCRPALRSRWLVRAAATGGGIRA